MSNQSHFTLAQALIIAALLLVTVGLALPIVQQQREYARRRMCGSNLNSLTKAMMIYASWALPRYDSSGTGGHAVGFREGDRRTNRGATLTDNVTAVLWMLVRDGTLSQNAFVCPSTDDRPDPLTIDGTDSGPLAVVDNTWDFYAREHLSYSIVNVYSPFVDWAESMPSAYVMFGDNNNNDWRGTPARHTLQSGAAPQDVKNAENSTNHAGKGQNLVFGDYHVEWVVGPFRGRDGDNVYAMRVNDVNVPPTFGHDDITDPHDVVLLPVTGNGGGAGSLDPND